jgi:hypothetical protein
MTEAFLQIRVSRRELDRPRLLQVVALDSARMGVEGQSVRVEVDENGTFADEEQLRVRDLTTAFDGVALFQWFEWPRQGPARDFTSTIRVVCEGDGVTLYVEDLYE